MKRFKLIGILAIAVMLAAPAWAGNIPEFDAVGCDSYNLFAITDLTQQYQVIEKNRTYDQYFNLVRVNDYSYFPPQWINTDYEWGEQFVTTAGQLFPDPCFNFLDFPCDGFESLDRRGFGYLSALTTAYNEAIYEWWIVLQMKPESDINLNIKDCVLKHNSILPFGLPGYPWEAAAEQTGRYRAPWGQLMFMPTANPSVSVKAYPGPFATPGFVAPLTMDARPMPGLVNLVPLDNVLYTSKAIWDEGIIMALPETGVDNATGQTAYNLKHGDQIRVTVTIPPTNTVDLRYGPDNVMLKYIGIVGDVILSDFNCQLSQ